jgi:hypothetical protein
MSLAFTISDLRQRPKFFDTVADRIWQASWKANGYRLDYISGRLCENMSDSDIPFALVAHDGQAFLGTASVIASDLAGAAATDAMGRRGLGRARGAPARDRRGFGQARRAGLLRARRWPCLSLRAADLLAFYTGLGWTAVETDVGPHHLTVFIRDAARQPSELNSPP